MVVLLRLLGWVLLTTSVLMASAEAVMAIGTGSYSGIATRELWTLLSGSSPDFGASLSGTPAGWRRFLPMAGAVLMETPAWLVGGPLGLGLVLGSRRQRRRRGFHR